MDGFLLIGGGMHIEKYKAPAVGGVSKHNARVWEGRGYERENIDNALIGENYNLAPDRGDAVAFVNDRIAALELKRAPRKDAVKMVEWVVTLPEGERDERAFFESTYRHMAAEYGEDNVVAAWVHKDEPGARPHMHFDFVPVTKDGRLSAKEIVNRNHLRQMHPKMQKLVSADLGHDVAFLLPEEERGRRELSRLDSKDWRAARDELDRAESRAAHARDVAERARQKALEDVENARQRAHAAHDGAVAAEREAQAAQARLEGLRRAEEAEAAEVAELDRAIEQARLQPPAETLAESARTLWTARSDGEREEGLRSEVEGIRSRIRELEGANQQARERVADLDRALPGLRERCRGLRARFEDAQVRVREVIGRLREVPETVSAWALDIAKKMGKRTYDPRSLEYQIESATRSAEIDRRQRGSVSHGRDLGRGIDR